MSALLKFLLSYLTLHAVEDEGGGPVDRGDDLDLPSSDPVTDEDEPAPAPADEKKAAEPESEPAEEQPRDADGKFAKKGAIPIDRHEAVLNKERLAREAAEARAAELEKMIRQADQNEGVQKLDAEINSLEAQLEDARLDGKKEDAQRLAREIRLKERELSRIEAQQQRGETTDNVRESIRMDMVIEKLENQYPMLDENSAEFDQDVTDLVLASQMDLITRERLSPSRALEAAVAKVMAKVMPAAREDAPEKPEGGLKEAKDAASDRKTAQVQKNLDAQKRQPASMKEVGIDSDKAGQTKEEGNVEQMTYEEFSALPEATKARLRGDLL